MTIRWPGKKERGHVHGEGGVQIFNRICLGDSFFLKKYIEIFKDTCRTYVTVVTGDNDKKDTSRIWPCAVRAE